MTDYDELAARAERGDFTAIAGTAVTGDAAAEAGRRLLMESTGTASIEEATRVALGRPRLSSEAGPTSIWKVRAPEALDARVSRMADHRGVTKSLVIREAVEEYLRAHG